MKPSVALTVIVVFLSLCEVRGKLKGDDCEGTKTTILLNFVMVKLASI